MWQYAVSAAGIEFFGKLNPKQRRRIRAILDQLAEHPPLDAVVAFADDRGRPIQIWRQDEFEILFWPDHSIQELRVIELDWARG